MYNPTYMANESRNGGKLPYGEPFLKKGKAGHTPFTTYNLPLITYHLLSSPKQYFSQKKQEDDSLVFLLGYADLMR